jgi:transposase
LSVSVIVSLAIALSLAGGWLGMLCFQRISGFMLLEAVLHGGNAGTTRQVQLDTSSPGREDHVMPGTPGQGSGSGSRVRAADAKETALRRSRTLNPRPQDVTDEAFTSGEFFDARDMVQVKYEMVRRHREGGASVTAAAAAFGLSRQSFYQSAAALDGGGIAALVPARPGPRGGHKLTAEVTAWITARKAADPRLRPADLAGLVEEQFGFPVHPRSVQRALARQEGASKRPG